MDTFVIKSIIEQEAPVNEEYGDEVLYAGWNPQLSQTADSPETQPHPHAELSGNQENLDSESFLKRIYTYQC